MTKMELTVEEQEMLEQVLENSLATLELEILHTDHQEFKETLKRRRAVLRGLLAKMQQPIALAA